MISCTDTDTDRHTDIQNDIVFLKASFGILGTFEQYLKTTTDPKTHIIRDDYIKNDR